MNDDDSDLSMGGPKRTRKDSRRSTVDDDSDNVSGSGSEDDSDFEKAEDWEVDVVENPDTVQVDLELFNMEGDDYFAVKNFLVPLLDGLVWGASDIAHHLADDMSAHIGTTVRVDGGREPYGILTVLNLHRTAGMEATRQIVRFLLSRITHKAQKQQLKQLLESKSPLGLLLNERVINVPAQIAPPLHMGFWEELEEAAQLEVANGSRALYFDFEHYVMITTVLEVIAGDAPGPRGKQSRGADRSIEYLKPEDEVYCRNSTFAFSYPVTGTKHGRWTMGGTVRERKVIVLWHKSAIPNILAQLSQLASNPDLYHSESPIITSDDGPFVNPLLEDSAASSSGF